MRLKMQMVVAGLVTLAIPVVGWHSIRQLDDALEESRRQEQQLRVNNAVASLATNTRLAQELKRRSNTTSRGDLFAARAQFPVFIDGYADDWRELTARTIPLQQSGPDNSDDNPVTASVAVRTTVRDGDLFVFVDVKDDEVVFHQPPRLVVDYAEGERPDPYAQLANGDALEVFLQRPTGSATHGLFRAVAPGPLVARVASNTSRRRLGDTLGSWKGHWTATGNGMQLELSMPIPPDGSSFGIAYVDVDKRGSAREQWVGSMDPTEMASQHSESLIADSNPQLRHTSEEAFDALASWVTPATRARLFDSHGRLMADVNALYEEDDSATAFDPANSSLWDALVYRLVSAMLRERKGEYTDAPLYSLVNGLHLPKEFLTDQNPLQQARRYQTDEYDFVLGHFKRLDTELEGGFLLFESNDSRASSYAGSRLAQLLSLLTLVSFAVGGSLLLFATVLSFRIRRLSKQASAAVSKDGRVAQFAASGMQDEIGELSRTIGSLLGRSKHYTQYLEALSSRLSHELRTPLSVVKTSIENIDVDSLDEGTQQLLDRASGGADQLGHIIKALVESTRLEQTMQQAQKVSFSLEEFLIGARARYQQVYPHIQFQADNNAGEKVFAAPELLQQALDKLVDNAVGFTQNSQVTLTLNRRIENEREWVSLAVSNVGTLADELDPASVFDPMFSSRTGEDGNLHLGLGLYIVRMVAEAHGGVARMQAANGVVTVAIDIPNKSS